MNRKDPDVRCHVSQKSTAVSLTRESEFLFQQGPGPIGLGAEKRKATPLLGFPTPLEWYSRVKSQPSRSPIQRQEMTSPLGGIAKPRKMFGAGKGLPHCPFLQAD